MFSYFITPPTPDQLICVMQVVSQIQKRRAAGVPLYEALHELRTEITHLVDDIDDPTPIEEDGGY